MNKAIITKGIIALVCVALVFATGLYFGRTGGPGGFTVTTQYAVGAMEVEELEALVEQAEARAEREPERPPPAGASEPLSQYPEPVAPDDGRININTAMVDGLTTLPGIGPVMAERIIAHREANGPFRIIEEITDVSGIGPARFSDIRELITVE